MLRHLNKPIRVVFRWQLAAAVVLTLAGGLLAGKHGAISAAAGAGASIIAGLVSAHVASWSGKSAGGVLLGALRAEAVKIGLAVLLVWVLLTFYAEVVVLAVLASFVTTMVIFSMAFFVREY